MDLIKWDETLEMGIEEIDEQHKKLVKTVNTFFNAMREAKGFNILEETLNQLADYGVYHFATEEKYFEKFHYPLTEEHIKEHKFFIDQITQLKEAFDSGKIKREGSKKILTVDLWEFIKEWLINHIEVDDQKYSELFKKNGLE